jgi:hypothetical protein
MSHARPAALVLPASPVADESRMNGALLLGLPVGLAVGTVGVIGWAIVAQATGQDLPLFAVLVGALVGFVMHRYAREPAHLAAAVAIAVPAECAGRWIASYAAGMHRGGWDLAAIRTDPAKGALLSHLGTNPLTVGSLLLGVAVAAMAAYRSVPSVEPQPVVPLPSVGTYDPWIWPSSPDLPTSRLTSRSPAHGLPSRHENQPVGASARP